MNLSVKIFISLILSVIVGLILGEENLPWLKAYLAPFGTMFINLIKMIIVPVVLASLVCGVASQVIQKNSVALVSKLFCYI